MSAALKALTPATIYQYRITATTLDGTADGTDQQLKTLTGTAP